MDFTFSEPVDTSKFKLEATRSTPYVFYDSSVAILELKGRSSPESSIDFYSKILDKLEAFEIEKQSSITVNVAFEYFNTSSAKCVFDMFKRLKNLSEKGKNVVLNWYYEEDDDDMFEAGEDFGYLLKLDINLLEH